MERIWQLKDITETLKQFNHLINGMKVLPLLSIIKKESCDTSDEESDDDVRTISVASPDFLGLWTIIYCFCGLKIYQLLFFSSVNNYCFFFTSSTSPFAFT